MQICVRKMLCVEDHTVRRPIASTLATAATGSSTTVGAATGTDYERQDLNSNADRRAVLTDVEKSVAQGVPVPVDVSGKEGAHAMTIIGQEGDKLQVYNPWGTTTWVSEDDFINGHMGKASNSDLPNTYSVYIPR